MRNLEAVRGLRSVSVAVEGIEANSNAAIQGLTSERLTDVVTEMLEDMGIECLSETQCETTEGRPVLRVTVRERFSPEAAPPLCAYHVRIELVVDVTTEVPVPIVTRGITWQAEWTGNVMFERVAAQIETYVAHLMDKLTEDRR